MKRTFIYSAVALLAIALFFTSCKPSRVWANKKKEKKEYAQPEKYDRRYENTTSSTTGKIHFQSVTYYYSVPWICDEAKSRWKILPPYSARLPVLEGI
ncbi:MAG: hypothetical protein IPH18_01425 [Chitinophagaceae bacterium]|nr:hypothetical protein [Chitinophagaceae bacterium]